MTSALRRSKRFLSPRHETKPQPPLKKRLRSRPLSKTMPPFDELAKRLADIANIPKQLPVTVADSLDTEIGKSFESERDPYGKAWKRLAPVTVRRKGHDRILFESGAMFAETRAQASGATIGFIGPDHGPPHQVDRDWNGRHVPARPVIPNEAALPKDWQQAISDDFGEAITRALKP